MGALTVSVKSHAGFTLVEVIFVVLILGIVTSIGSSFLVDTLGAYRSTQARSVLVQRGRLVIEQISRHLRMAAPHSVRVSTSGLCIEFMPTVAGANYQVTLPDANNGMSAVSSVATGAFTLGLWQPEHVLVAPMSSTEVYTSASTAARVDIGTLGSEPIISVPFASAHRFLRNSRSSRLYLAGDPERFCLDGSILYNYRNYGLETTALIDTDPGGNSHIVSHDISTQSQLFQLSPGAENRNTAVMMDLSLSSGSNTLRFNHEVLIKNVP